MRHTPLMLSLAAALALSACAKNETPATAATPAASSTAAAAPATQVAAVTDEHSFAQPDKVRTTDLALDLAVDFAKKTLSGTATLTLDWVDPTATQLILDTRDLNIAKIEGQGADGNWAPLQFKLADTADKVLGTKLTIETPDRPKAVRITYATSPNARGSAATG